MFKYPKLDQTVFFIFSALVCILIFFIAKESEIFTHWYYIIGMDGRGYYSYLPAIFIHQDLTFNFYSNASPIPGDEANFLIETGSGKVNKYPFGVSLFLLPFFLLSWVYSYLFEFSLNGYSQPFYIGVFGGAVLYSLFGLYFLRKLLLLLNFSTKIVYSVLILIFFGTNLFYYTVYEPSMSHVYSFAIISSFCFFTTRFFKQPEKKDFILISILFALIVIVRPVNFLLIFAIPFLAGSIFSLKLRIQELFIDRKLLISGIIVFLSIIGIQMFLWYLQSGRLLVYSYGEENFNFSSPEILNVLFSYRKGLFIYTPLLFLALFGFIPLLKRSSFSFFSLVIFLSLLVFVISSWWCWFYGWSFGQRAFIDFYPFFAVLLANLFSALKNPFLKTTTVLSSLAILSLSLVQTYQINRRILHYADMNKERYWEVFLKTGKDLENKYYIIPHEPFIETERLSLSYNFDSHEEENNFWSIHSTLSDKVAFSGSNSAKIDLNNKLFFKYPLRNSQKEKEFSFKISSKFFGENSLKDCFLEITFETENEKFDFISLDLNEKSKTTGEWEHLEFKYSFPESLGREVLLNISFFSKGETTFYVDDFEVYFY